MNVMQSIRARLIEAYPDEPFTLLEDEQFDAAIVGVGYQHGTPSLPAIVYSYDKLIEVLMSSGITDRDEAIEYLEYNIVSGKFGERSPIIMQSITEEA